LIYVRSSEYKVVATTVLVLLEL